MSRILTHVHDYSFNPKRDMEEVKDGLAVDITDMMQTGVVKDAGESLDNNGIDDPTNIIGLVRDNFAAVDASRAIKKYGKKDKGAAQAAAEKAAATAAPAPSQNQ